MNQEQKASYVNTKVALMLCEMYGMVAENQQRIHRNESIAYDLDAFTDLEFKYGLDENHLTELLRP